jgi:hypothetical protein
LEKQKLLKPILIGGLFSGLLSSLPCINSLNCVCCMWVVAGGAVSSYIMINSASHPPPDGSGVLAGIGSGVVASVFTTLYTLIFLLVSGAGEFQTQIAEFSRQVQSQPEEVQKILRPSMEMMENTSPFLLLLMGSAVNFFFYIASGAVGGLVGLRVFTPRRFGPVQTGAYPPGYGGFQQGGQPPWQTTPTNTYDNLQPDQHESDMRRKTSGKNEDPEDNNGPPQNSGGAPPTWGGN